ncbi:hypothetical protein DY245_07545 [Streptomyces inhibens]|uniref:Uncharacterized protein n=1 Tax=Streptomyces inhibens TaxID=2293571 RepID=A0A371Q8A4_STRIH|nr:hypothetical protein DY245_07545 [Streptomyces inhibens]
MTILPVFVSVRNWQSTFGAVLDVSAVTFAVRGTVSALTTPIVPASITARHDAAISRGMRLQMPLAMTPPLEWMDDVGTPHQGWVMWAVPSDWEVGHDRGVDPA